MGVHDDFEKFLNLETQYKISAKKEILSPIREEDFLKYIAENKEIILIVPHPRHFFFEFYGKREIKELAEKIQKKEISIPLFVEEKTGYDPFPRILHSFNGQYPILGDADAHEICGILGTNSFFSVKTAMPCNFQLINLIKETISQNDLVSYKKVVKLIFDLLKNKNNDILITKNYLASIVHFFTFYSRLVRQKV